MSLSKKCKSGARPKAAPFRSDGEIFGVGSHQGPLMHLSVGLSLNLMNELTAHAKRDKKRPAALAQEILQVWLMTKREKELAHALKYQCASREDREAMLYGSSLHDVDIY